MNITIKCSLLFCLLLEISCASHTKRITRDGRFNTDCQENICDVSMIQLIATPEKFHNKKVRVIGVVAIRYEDTALYLDSVSYERHLYHNAIWMPLPGKEYLEKLEHISGIYVFAEGIFDANLLGHFGAYSGTLRSISRVDPRPND